MNKDLRDSIKKFNEVIANFDLSLLENLGRTTNLKLHDIVFKYSDMNYFYNIFHEFCQSELAHFEEILNCNYIKMTHIGRTSSFYLEHENFNLFEYNYYHDFENKSPLEKLEMLILNEINHWFDVDDFTLFSNSIIKVNEDFIDHEDVDMLTNEIRGTIDVLKDLNYMYDHIDSVKDRQCELFMEFIEDQEF